MFPLYFYKPATDLKMEYYCHKWLLDFQRVTLGLHVLVEVLVSLILYL